MVKKGKVVIAGDKLTFVLDEEKNPVTFTLDPAAKPAAIDFKAGSQLIRGIDTLDKDKLTICFGIENSARPTEFKPGRDNSIMVLERVKK